jgi:uncharacterized membrane protein (TIGR02234 family)
MTAGEGHPATPSATGPVRETAPSPAGAPRSGRGATREKTVAALLAAAGAGLILMSDGRGWADATVTAPVHLSVAATGSDLTSLPYALGLAGLAGAVALFAVRRVGRYLVGLVLLAAGLGTVAAVAAKLGRLDGADLARAAEQTLGAGAAQIGSVTNTAWPYVTIGGGVLVALGGVLTLARGRAWTGLSNRYEVAPAADAPASGPAAVPAPAAEPSARELWDALNRGADPTA